MDDRSLLGAALEAVRDTLVTLGHTLVWPPAARRYCERCNVPPITLESDWSDGVAALSGDWENLGDAEKLAQVLLHLEGIYHATDAVLDHESPEAGIEFARRLIQPILFAKLREQGSGIALGLYTFLMFLVVADERLKEETPDVFLSERWMKLIVGTAVAGGFASDPDAEAADPAIGDRAWAAGAGLTMIPIYYLGPALWNWLLGKSFKWPFKAFFHAGFDHPDVPGLEEPLDAARHSFVAFFNARTQPLAESAYQSFDLPESPWKHRKYSLAIVPLARTAAHGGGVYVQFGGTPLVWKLGERTEHRYAELSLGGAGGFLIPRGGGPLPGVLPAVSGTLAFEAAYSLPPDDEQPEDGSDIPEGVSFSVRRFAVSARVTALPTYAGATVRLEGAELRIGKLPVLDVVFPAGIRVNFDFGIVAAAGGGVHLEGGLGGELEIPLDLHARVGGEKYEIFDARVRSVRVTVGRRDNGIRIELAANASARLFGILSAHADGAGVALTLRPSDGKGKLAIADFDWEPVFPAGVGIELAIWKIKGGGYLRYDAPTQRLVGSAELAIGELFTVKCLGVGTKLEDGSKSWVIVGSLTTVGGGLVPSGIGVLYGTRRTSDPEAFLNGLRSGALDAVLFPDKPVENAHALAGTLDRLFPTAPRGDLIGIMARWSFFGGKLVVDFGGLAATGARDVDHPDRYYLVARVRADFPKESPAIRIQADGVAVWTPARGEFQLRIVLRESKLFGGELTGEAMAFRGRVAGKTQTFLSIGGFHPAYVPPEGIFVPRRLQLTVSRGDHLKIDWQLYLAYTPGGLHFGVQTRLLARFSGFGIRGALAFDMLIGLSDGSFDIAIAFSVEVLLGSRVLAGIQFKGTVSGLSPTVLSGSVSIRFLFWTWSSGRRSITLKEGSNDEEFADIAALLDAALVDPATWDGGPVGGLAVSGAARTGVWLSPSAPLEMRQSVVPLGRTITRTGAGRLAQPASFAIVPEAPSAAWTTRPLAGEFAPAMYFQLTDEQALAVRGFEDMPCGFAIDRAFETEIVLDTDLSPEEIVIDSSNPPEVPRTRAPRDLGLVAAALALDGDRRQIRGPAVGGAVLLPERFSVVEANLAVVSSGTSYIEALAVAHTTRRMVVPVSEAA